MRDAVGNDLVVGDKVVTMMLQYRDLVVGTVIGFTAKMVKVEIADKKRQNWSHSQNGYVLKHPSQLCVIITRLEKEDAVSEAYHKGIQDERYAASSAADPDPFRG